MSSTPDYLFLLCYPVRGSRTGEGIWYQWLVQEFDVCFPGRSWVDGHRLGCQEAMAKQDYQVYVGPSGSSVSVSSVAVNVPVIIAGAQYFGQSLSPTDGQELTG